MSSVIREKRHGRTLYRVQFVNGDGKRKSIRLAQANRRMAQSVASKIDALNACRIGGEPPSPSLTEWLNGLGSELHSKLANAGLAERRTDSTLGAFAAAYIEGREAEDLAKSTIDNFRQVERCLIAFFGADRDLRSISEGEADSFKQWLMPPRYASATVSKVIKRARQIFKSAVRNRACDSNPFADVKAGSEKNDERKYFVEYQTIEQVLEHCPDAEWRLIVALSRYGGLRTPSETLLLRWEDIDWAEGRFTVTSPKTKRHGKATRVVPIFPELRPYLSEAFELSAVGSEYAIQRYRDPKSNLRTQFERILRRAGVEAWPRLFQNLRSSRETELANDFPLHVVTAWLGNTPKVATEHYLQVTPQHFADAATQRGGGATGGAQVVQQVVQQPAASSCNERQQVVEAEELSEQNLGVTEALCTCSSSPGRTRRYFTGIELALRQH